MKFHTTETLGPKQSLTNDGYLICKDVPIARTGQMYYGPNEVPVSDGGTGHVVIERYPEEVFRDETVSSFEGKPVTMDHPDDFVSPENWSGLSKGVTMNVRRGEGMESDFLFADLMIYDKQAIADVRSGLREVSCGYDADYEEIEPGRGAQRNIIGNHVALVERGRCGPRCAIGDKDTMATKPSWLDKIKAAINDAEAEGETEAEKEAREKKEKEDKDKADAAKTSDALGAILNQLKVMDADIKKLKARDAEEETEEEKAARLKKEKESTTDDDLTDPVTGPKLDQSDVLIYTGDSATRANILARAEILSPGVRLPTLDKKTSTNDAALQLCGCQRRALGVAYKTDDGRKAIDTFLGGQKADFEKMSVPMLNAVFTGAAELIKAQNTASGTFDGSNAGKSHAGGGFNTADSIRSFSKKADALWGGSSRTN